MYPDQSLYPANSVPAVVERINNTFRRADQIQWSAGIEPGDPRYVDYFLPIVADAEAGFGICYRIDFCTGVECLYSSGTIGRPISSK